MEGGIGQEAWDGMIQRREGKLGAHVASRRSEGISILVNLGGSWSAAPTMGGWVNSGRGRAMCRGEKHKFEGKGTRRAAVRRRRCVDAPALGGLHSLRGRRFSMSERMGGWMIKRAGGEGRDGDACVECVWRDAAHHDRAVRPSRRYRMARQVPPTIISTEQRVGAEQRGAAESRGRALV